MVLPIRWKMRTILIVLCNQLVLLLARRGRFFVRNVVAPKHISVLSGKRRGGRISGVRIVFDARVEETIHG
jgi:hypothetical protein